jgi:hypothetical protein
MMTLFGTTIGAAWPLFLLAIPVSLALLVYIFRAKGSSQPTVTSTLFLLRKLPSYLPHRKRFIPPLQFWLELLAFILLASAASGVFTRETGERIAVVLDTSKSMATRQTSGETRLEVAKRIASADITQSPPTTRFAVYSASNTLVPLTPSNATQQKSSSHVVSARSARSLLTEAPQSYTADRLQSLLTPLVNAADYDQVWVYTDKTVEDTSEPGAVKIISIPSDSNASGNLWIESLTLKSSTTSTSKSDEDTPYIYVSLAAVGPETISAQVSAECTQQDGGSTFSLSTVTTTLKPNSSASTRLGPIAKPWSYCRVVATPSSAASLDLLPLDNEGWVTKVIEERTVTLHSALSPDALGLRNLPYAVATPAVDSQAHSELYSIYHRQLPKTLPPKGATMIVLPPAGSTLWSGGSVAARASTLSAQAGVTRWSDSHPLMQYLQPTLLTIPTAVVLTCPDTAKPVLFTSEGPLLCAGEQSGSRYIITGFELFPFDGLRSPTVSIFTLNALRWLFQPAAGGNTETSRVALDNSAQVGTIALPYEISSAQSVAPTRSNLANSTTRSLTIPEPGVVELSRGETSSAQKTFLAVNAFSPDESDISRIQVISPPQSSRTPQAIPAATTAQAREKSSLESILTVLLLVALGLDLLRRIVTRARWGGVV